MKINESVKFRIEDKRTKLKHKREYMSPKYEAPLSPKTKTYSQYNYQDIKRPLKTNHQDLSFKGLSFGLYNQVGKYSKVEFLKFSDKYIGKMGRELFEDITQKHASQTNKLIQVNGDEIIVSKKSIPHLAIDGMLYPFKILPFDMLNGVVELLAKVPGLKTWATKILDTSFFKNIRQRSKIDSKVNSLTGLITYKDVKLNSALESFAKQKGIKVGDIPQEDVSRITQEIEDNLDSHIFQSKLKMFDPKSGNYDTKHERSLNRLVSGLPPAIFLANDAYNLSRMMDDDSKAAEKERKTRFKQETSRILTSGYLTLITMGAFQSFINRSKMGIVITTGLTVLVTEMYSRLSNGKHITRLTPEEARAENAKNHAKEAEIKPLTFKAEANKSQPQAKSKEQQKPLLSFDTIMKASGVVLGTGYGLKFAKKIPAIEKAALKYFENMKANDAEKFESLGIKDLKQSNAVKEFQSKVIFRPFTSLYKNLTAQKFEVETEKFDAVVKVLKENGFDKLAEKYDRVGKAASKTVDGKSIIDFGSKDKKTKPLVDFVIAPFKFMWNTVTLPYWMVDEKILGAFRKAGAKSMPKDLNVLAKSFDRISRQAEKLGQGKISQKDFQDYVQVNLLKGFNVDSISSVSNAELSNLAKTAATVATIWFLMTDNYNMVMLKSNGNDKNGAETKFKERFVQEGSRLFYQTLLIDLFNSTFRNQYNSSLLGMSLITVTNTTLGEMLTRSSVGTPLKAHTRDELVAIETAQNNAKGFKRKYYDFMQRLTGKRSIKSYEVKSNNPQPKQFTKAQQTSFPTGDKVFFKQNGGTLEKMIRG